MNLTVNTSLYRSIQPLVIDPPEKCDDEENEFPNLLSIKFSERDKLFSSAIEKNLLHSDGSLNSSTPIIIPSLSQKTVLKLLQELSQSHLTRLLMHILEISNEIHPLSSLAPFKIVGSWVFWILGEEYVKNILSIHGLSLDLQEDTLNSLFKKPADLDLRIYMDGASILQMQQMGVRICEFLKREYGNQASSKLKLPNLKQIKPIPSESNCFYPLPLILFGRKIDIILISILNNPSLFADDNICIDLTKEILLASQNLMSPNTLLPDIAPLALTNNTKTLSLEEGLSQSLYPQNERLNHRGVFHALLLKVCGVKWAPLVSRINAQGAYKYILSLGRQSVCLSEEFELPLVKSFMSMLQHVKGSEYAIGLLHKSVQNHVPNEPAAYTVTCFNICALLQTYQIDDWKNWARLLFNEMGSNHNIQESLAPKTNFYALYQLLKTQLIPFEVLSSYLLALSILLESNKCLFGQQAPMSSTVRMSASRKVVFTTFHAEKLSLMLPSDLLFALKSLKAFFIDNPQALSSEVQNSLHTLCQPFYQGLKANFTQNKKHIHASDKTFAREIYPLAETFLDCKQLKTLGFCLLCLFGENSEELNFQLSRRLVTYLQTFLYPEERLAAIQSYFYFYGECLPYDTLFQNGKNIEKLFQTFSQSCTSELDSLKQLCKLLSSSSNSKIAIIVLEIWEILVKQIQPSESLRLANEIIDSYLTINPPDILLSLKAFKTFSKSPKIGYGQLEPKFYKIYCLTKKQHRPSYLSQESHLNRKYLLPLILKKNAIILLNKLRGNLNSSQQGNYFLELVEDLLKDNFNEDAIELFKILYIKNIFPKSYQPFESLRFKICEVLFETGPANEATHFWIQGIQNGNQSIYVKLLLNFQKTDLDQSNISRQLIQELLLRACVDKIENNDSEKIMLRIAYELKNNDLGAKNLQPKGQFLLLELVKHYSKQSVNNKHFEHLSLYLKCLDELEIDWKNTQHSTLVNKLGAHCFSLYYPNSELATNHWLELQAFALILLQESHDEQVLGFALLCHAAIHSSISSPPVDFFTIFSTILVNETLKVRRSAILKIFIKFLENLIPSSEAHALCSNLKDQIPQMDSSDEILRNIICFFSESSNPYLIELVLKTSNQISLPEEHMLLVLKRLLKFAPEEAIPFYNSLETKGLLGKVQSSKLHSIQLDICRQLYTSERKLEAGIFFTKIQHDDPESSVSLLLEWSAENPPSNFLEILQYAHQFKICFRSESLLAKLISENLIRLPVWEEPVLSWIEKHLDWIIARVKSEESLLEMLLKRLVSEKFSLIKYIEHHSLWNHLISLINSYSENFNFQNLCKDLVLDEFKSNKTEIHKANFFFQLALSYSSNDWLLAYSALKRGFFASDEYIKEDFHEVIFTCLEFLFKNKKIEECYFLLLQIKKFLPLIHQEKQAFCWYKFLVTFDSPICSKIFVKEKDLLEKFIDHSLLKKLAHNCINLSFTRKNSDELLHAMQLSDHYGLHSAYFWKTHLPHLMQNSAVTRKVIEVLAFHPNPFSGEPEETAICWMAFINFASMQNNSIVFYQLKNRIWEILEALRSSSDLNEILKTYFNFSLGLLSLYSDKELTVEDQESIPTQIKLLSELYEAKSEESQFVEFNYIIAEKSLKYKNTSCLAIACDSIIKICHLNNIYSDRLYNLGKKAVENFEKNSCKNSIQLKLKHISYLLIKRYPKKVNILFFHSFLERHGGLGSFDLSYKVLKTIFNEIASFPEVMLGEVHKNTIKPILSAIISHYQNVSLKKVYTFLKHPSILCLLTSQELSSYWADLLNNTILKAKNSPSIEMKEKTISLNLENIHLLTGASEKEMNCFEGFADLLITYYLESNDYEYYSQELMSICQLLKDNVEWDNFQNESKKVFASFVLDPLLGSFQFKKSFASVFAKLSSHVFINDGAKLSLGQLVDILYTIIGALIKHSEKTLPVEHQGFIQANIFYLVLLFIHSSPKPSLIFEVILILSASNPSLDPGIASFQSFMNATLFKYAQKFSGIDAECAEKMFDIMLLQRYKAADLHIKLPKNQEISHLVKLILTLCSKEIASQTARAFAMLESSQFPILVDQPTRLKSCYQAIIKAAAKDPWMIVAQVRMNTQQFSTLTVYTTIIEEAYVNDIEEGSLIPLILGVGRALIQIAEQIVFPNPENFSQNKYLSHFVLPEMEATLKELICEYLGVVYKCITEIKFDPPQFCRNKRFIGEYSEVCLQTYVYIEKIKKFPFMADQTEMIKALLGASWKDPKDKDNEEKL